MTSGRMSRQKRKGTEPEMRLRRLLHRRGLRYRVNFPLQGLPRRRADLTFIGAKVVVFVDGCFWHRCPEHATSPANNGAWWEHKLETNVARDRDTDSRMQAAGWVVLRFWEHEDMEVAAERVAGVVTERRART